MTARPKTSPIAATIIIFGALLSAQDTTTPPTPRPDVRQVQIPMSTGPRRVEVLFLGQTGAAHPSDRFASVLRSALAQYGFNFSYTATPVDLNAAQLAQYDALMIYGDHRLTPDQEQAALAFVNGGKGFLSIHTAHTAAVSSNQTSAAYIALAGAGLQQRTHGNGRVFYTADGHDERTWTDPAFHTAIRNGLTWAIGSRVASQLAALKLQPLRYTSSVVPIPNYERRAEAPKLQSALSTAEATKHIQVPPGFELQLFAAEPLVTGNPMAMAWDERGRLWLAESKDYPNNIQPPGQGNDVIRILEDTNHDGRADKATTFADKLTVATSLVFVNGGIVVSQARELTFLKDTNGDDRADVRETLIAGWSIRDTHALASNLKYGLDNWIWGAVGYSGFNGTVGGKRLVFNQAIYRFSRDAHQMEHVANFTNNMWGLGFNETGDVFGSTANGEHSVHVAIPLPYYEGVTGLTADGKKKLDGHYAMQVNTPKIRQVDVMGGFTAAAGHNFYTARAFPEEYWNRIAFVNEPTGRVVHRAIIERRGSGFTEQDGWNVAASDDEWFAPVHAEVGPDGALWLADFYDFIIQHNPTPFGPVSQGHSYTNGRGNAYETPLREHARGRIYRLAWKGAAPYTPISLTASGPAELVQALRHDNMFWRMTSQRLLVERGEIDVLPQLVAMINDRSVDRLGLNPGALHALWTLHGLGALDGSNAVALDAATGALSDPAAGVRKAAMAVLPKSTQSLVTLLAAGVLKDADLNVRLNALLAVSEMPASIEAGRAIYELSTQKDVIDDEWLPEAVWIAATKHQDGFQRAHIDDIGPVEFARISVRGARGERAGAVDWSASAQDETGWMTLAAPRVWAETPIGDFVGTVWLRRTIDIPAAAAGRPAQIRLGIVDDTDVTYVNGTRINATTNMRNAPRQYSIPAGVLVAGRNVVAVRISNVNGRGGFAPDPPPAPGVPMLQPQAGAPALAGMVIAGDGFNVPLAGEWRAKIEETWDGGRRREVLTSASIAQQILLANSPVADLFTATAAGTRGMPAAAAATPGSGTAASTVPAGNDAQRITLGVVPGQMKFDTQVLTVRAGERVELAFNNTDDMPHNVVIFKRGDIAAYEPELFGSMNEPFAQQRGFVPDSPNVLFATRLLNARESTVLSFGAPKEPGDYPFVCSFPGHWLLMRGVLRVE